MLLWCGTALGEGPCNGRGFVFVLCGAARLRGSAPGPSLLGAERQPSRDTQPRRGLRHSEFRLRPRPIEASGPGAQIPRTEIVVRKPVGRNQRVGHGRSWRASEWAHAAQRPVTELGVPKAWADPA